jgi:hypothetical protein
MEEGYIDRVSKIYIIMLLNKNNIKHYSSQYKKYQRSKVNEKMSNVGQQRVTRNA